MARRMHAVGQQRPGKSTPEIDPHAGAGEAGMADGLVRTGVAAGPAVVTRLPPQASRRRLPRAQFRQPWSAPCSRRCAASSTPSIVPNRPAWPAAPPSAKAFSSCTSPRITRPRQVQRSVAAVSVGSGRQVRLRRRLQSRQGRSGQPLDGDAQQHEIDVGIDRRAGAATTRCRMKARSVAGSSP